MSSEGQSLTIPVISSHPLPMELYVPGLPSIPIHLVFLIVTACCASLFPYSLSWGNQYEICQSNKTCDNITFEYPFGVGKNGCGDPRFQVDCVLNSNPVIEINNQEYTILQHYQNNSFLIVKGQDCQFSDGLQASEFAGSGFNITSSYKWTLNVYRCDASFVDIGGEFRKCNDTFHYTLSDLGYLVPLCGVPQQVTVYDGISELLYDDTQRNESCTSCRGSGGICGYNVSVTDGVAPFLCYCEDGPHTDKCSGKGKGTNGVAIGVSVGAAALIAAGILMGLIWYRRRKSESLRKSLVGRSVRDDEDKGMETVVQGKIGTMPIFSYEVLKQATNYFDEKNQLGDGGFGSVYLGKLPDGRAVAVKRLYQDNSRRVEQFINEVQILSSFYHPNLVILYGCTSPESRDLLLVYEYVPNGTLADHLHGERKNGKGLNWDTRLKICIETAQALAFLHSLEPPIFHRDVKSTNILLDEHFQVKVADFGLSRFVPLDATHVSTAPQGTPGYIDPEYHQCFQLSDKSDVYSFGVVLMEIISAKIAVDINRTRREIVLATMAIAKVQDGSLHELVDPNLDIDGNPHIKLMVNAVAELAFRCLAPEKDSRPNMKEVVTVLEQIKQNGGKRKDPALHPLSPTSVQEKWPSTRTTPENSASSI